MQNSGNHFRSAAAARAPAESQPRRSLLTRLVRLGCLALLCALPTTAADQPKQITIWGLSPHTDDLGLVRVLERYAAGQPGIALKIVTAGKAEVATEGSGFSQKFMTALAAGKTPDLVFLDRFTLAGWAARGALLPLDDYVANSTVNPADFYTAPRAECTFDGRLYGIPYGTDARAFFWNKKLFRAAGLDPERPPRDWEELIVYAQRLTKYNVQGQAEQLGFAPILGNSWLYLYGWLNGARFLSEDGRRVLLDSPEVREALVYIKRLYDALGGRRDVVDPFERGYGRDATDPFLIGKLAMRIDGNWYLNKLARLAPDFELGVAPPPAPSGKPTTTWSGGFAWVIPTNSKHPDETWRLIEYLVSPAGLLAEGEEQSRVNAETGNALYVPKLIAHKAANEERLRAFPIPVPALQRAQEVFVELLNVSHFRPVTPVGQQLWDEHVRATDLATCGALTPEQALRESAQQVQKAVDAFYADETRPVVPLQWSFALAAVLLLTGLAVLLWHLRRLRQASPRAWLEARTGLIFALPWVIGFLVLMFWPTLTSLLLSLTEYDVLSLPRWVGFKNFVAMFSGQDMMFWRSLGNTLYLAAFGVPLSLITGLSIALLVNQTGRSVRWYRTILYLPAIVPAVAVAIVWMFLLNPQNGLINFVLAQAGMASINWLGDPRYTKVAVIMMLLWGAGGSMVIWLAGLKSIPPSLYEAARIDGAGTVGRFFRITLPLLSPYVFFNLIMSLIAYFQIFTQPYLLDARGGPEDSLRMYVFYLFDNAFKYFKMGYASAMAWILFLIILALTLVNFKLAPKWVYYADE